jgi:hypothetical protein
MRIPLLVFFLLTLGMASLSAQSFTVFGRVTDTQGRPMPGTTVVPQGISRSAAITDMDGEYTLHLRTETPVEVAFTFVGYTPLARTVSPSTKGTRLDVMLTPGVALGHASVEADGSRREPLQRIEARIASRVPSVRGTVEDLLMQAPVNFTSELSSAYNVRGGSFDENLVYVNGIEVYRPFLVRAGQQEGLSFPNPDMIQSIRFSAGGFEAKYGDRMSSVLDIQYRRPQEFAARTTASLLGASVQVEDASADNRWTYNLGVRYRNNGYILGALDEQGEYKPEYTDAQAYVTFDPDGFGPWELQALVTAAKNKYQFLPKTRETNVGTINEALRLTVYFDGQEVTQYATGFAALAADRVAPTSRVRLIASAFRTNESETFDILGSYFLNDIERDPGSDAFGDAMGMRGVGSFLNHARNNLEATVLTAAVRGSAIHGAGESHLEWGATSRYEQIDDALSEWELIDSAGFVVPHPADNIGFTSWSDRPDQQIVLQDVIRTEESAHTFRNTAFAQNTWDGAFENGTSWTLNAGARIHHWSLTSALDSSTHGSQLIGGPRAHASLRPDWTLSADSAGNRTVRDVVFKLAGGWYYQPPFYREMRGIDGVLNPDVRAQRAIHAMLGADYRFDWWGRPFVMNAEVYYKDLDALIPYEVENVRLRYHARNRAKGYATGLDVMLNGEFIDGIQSWMRMSVLKTEEDLLDDDYYDYYNADGLLIIPGYTFDQVAADSTLNSPGYIPRPTDQRVSVSMLFQDEMPRSPEYKVLVSLYFGTGLPFGPPDFDRYKDILRLPPYRRVDIGFSRDLFTKEDRPKNAHRSGFIALEVFNILDIRNTINHVWIQDVTGRNYAIPNYLTGRRLNLKVALNF